MNRELLFALLAAFSFGVAPIFEKLGLARTEPSVALFIRAGVTTLGISVYLFFLAKGGKVEFPDFHSIVHILLGGVFGVLFAQFFYFKALQYGEVGRVMPVVGSFPVLAFLLSVIVFGETVTFTKMIGSILVVAGVILLGD
ncbi:transporter family protein [Melghirimyces thermohalophilus]|uniref:Transporter family protein n=1 Tax=Melghirimyces thermohalophilus TaxID=1236220 RepID=A0A1G6KWS9_9BACL|nr:EamA family transporter [Melghirimyces thermohalophilus]SDC34915.1 transporter family protein [Melghirimyces thermohalophilus]